ncbi:MAG: LacI family DNA-binding transcriptional regulator [Clostridia bacterium]|nr:LacI family DNA-binding transcriptional regulator [Clostridia bacterium]
MSGNVTIYTIAEELKVTPSLVSRAFNPNASVNAKKRELILRTAEKYNFVPNKMASRLSMKEIVIGVLLYFRFEPCYSELIRGIKAAHEELKDYKIKCDMRFLDKNKHSIEECRQILDDFSKYDGIIIGGISYDNHGDIITELYQKNRNIVMLDNHSEGQKRLFSSVFDVESSARLAADFLSNCLFFSERKNIVLFTGDTLSSVHRRRRDAFEKMAKQNGLNIISQMNMCDSAEKLRELCYSQLGDCPYVDGIYITSGNSVELCRYIEEKGLSDKIVLVTFDTFPELNEYLKRGIVNATIYQNLFGQAKAAFEALVQFISDGRGVDDVITTRCELVMRNNIEYYE